MSAVLSSDELHRILDAHAAWLRGDPGEMRADLRGATLRGADLGAANLEGATLRGADLGAANLHAANLHRADLRGADLHRADLGAANLHAANLCAANLHRADLRAANLYRTDLRAANLCGADLRGATLRGADLGAANLEGATLHGADLGGLQTSLGLIPDMTLPARILDQITTHPETWEKQAWHSPCGTAHCIAGWAITFSGPLGRYMEATLGAHTAATLLLWHAGCVLPSFAPDASEAETLGRLRALAEHGV